MLIGALCIKVKGRVSTGLFYLPNLICIAITTFIKSAYIVSWALFSDNR